MRKFKWKRQIALTAITAMLAMSVFGCSNTNSNGTTNDSGNSGADGGNVTEGKTLLSDADLDAAFSEVSYSRDAVHDPSIVVAGDGEDKTYYVFGSHMAVSKSTDLMNWTNVTSESETSALFGTVDEEGNITRVSYNRAFRDNAYKGTVTILVDGVETEVDFGTYDASEWNTCLENNTVAGNMWAPDVIYNPVMEKWCMYLSLNGPKWNSSIILLTADEIEGPYVYQGPVIYSGFNGQNEDIITYDKTDLSLVYPGITEIPSKYRRGSGWGNYWPHAIDPCVSYDEDGNLWMTYGSWSGGIYAIELDEETGLRDYTVVYEDLNTGEKNVTSDAYFGTKIAGGYYVSGEGSYIEKIGDYWYLFMSYGFYSPDGGYEMRIFRSENINGPYEDASGKSAVYLDYEMNYGMGGTIRGEKLMSGYQWDSMSVGEISQGHNSAFVDDDGNAYVVYHTKFNDGTVSHAIRVHQLYVNEDGWLTVAPYEYSGETVNDSNMAEISWETADIVGEYQVIIHNYGKDYVNLETTTPSTITLKEDGTIEGAYTGKWEITTGSYVVLTLNDVMYKKEALATANNLESMKCKGEIVEQTIDGLGIKTLCFTAASLEGVNVWGSKMVEDTVAIAMTRNSLDLNGDSKIFPSTGNLLESVVLPDDGLYDTVITWSSSNEVVLSKDGQVTVLAQDEEVVMTCTLSKGDYCYQKEFTVTVLGEESRKGDTETGKVALFEFEGDFVDSIGGIEGVAEAQSAGTKPSIKNDTTLNSQVVQVNFGYDSANSSNYLTIPNPLKGSTTKEATISMQLKRTDSDVWDAIWGFMDDDFDDDINGRLYFTGNAYLGYNGSEGWFDANHANTGTNAIPVGQWSLVTIAMDSDGFYIYINGVLKYTPDSCDTFDSGAGFSSYGDVMDMIASADTFYLGYGSWWGSDPFLADDLVFYDRALSETDVAGLYAEFQTKMEK
ncbi:MAG: family 43 glycosylhydrolase [Lachnospiraceae bacterium]